MEVLSWLDTTPRQREQSSSKQRPRNMRGSSTRSAPPHCAAFEPELKCNCRNLPAVAVVVDPIIARHLRPHQIEGTYLLPLHVSVGQYFTGVKFLYECVMGLRRHEGQGCILADEMYVFTLAVAAMSLILRFQGSGENPSGMFFFRWIVFPPGDIYYRQLHLSGHSLVSSIADFHDPVFKISKRAESVRWYWASHWQGLDCMPRIAGQCSFSYADLRHDCLT